ncbi:T9SS type A sorting domain-containing protein [Ekhidna sp.]|uniref:T9SS type A sorting domain-containing protein n=1 Tax=Ekhidna sp. TaxID=2608089 RepID=UPI003CCBC489
MKSITTLIFLTPCFLFSQFVGGNGAGIDDFEIVDFSLDGTSLSALYNGGDGHGSTFDREQTTLNGQGLNVLYNGGDGYGYFLFNEFGRSLNGDNLNARFSGGTGNGDIHLITRNSSLNGQNLNVIFFSGSGRGDYLFSTFSVDLNGAYVGPPFFGGNGNGDVVFYELSEALDGSNLSPIFFSSDGAGFESLRQLHLSANGVDLSQPFFSGDGDGMFGFPALHVALDDDDLGVLFLSGNGNGSDGIRQLSIALEGSDLSFIFTSGSGRGESVATILNTPLPVDLISFEGIAFEDRIKLIWKTAQEINNDRFIIEKSLDGSFWSTIGSVEGSGNSTELITYNFSDLYPERGIQFYRLKQIDFNGSYEYSPIISVDFDKIGLTTTIYPNPNHGELSIGLDEVPKEVFIRILDLKGIIVFSSKLDSGKLNLDISNLKDNIYHIEVIVDGRKSIHTIIKN